MFKSITCHEKGDKVHKIKEKSRKSQQLQGWKPQKFDIAVVFPAVTHTPNYASTHVNVCVCVCVYERGCECACEYLCVCYSVMCVSFLTFSAELPNTPNSRPLTSDPAAFHTSPWKQSWNNTDYWPTSSLPTHQWTQQRVCTEVNWTNQSDEV